jgi:rod shape-determining protein MreD
VSAWIRSFAIVALGAALLVVQSTIGALLPIHPFEPNLLLPMAFFLGVSPEVRTVRGAFISFGLGYVLDLFAGYPMSLYTLLLVATFLVARGAGLRFFPRNVAFQMLLTFAVALIVGGAAVALRTMFGRRDLPPIGDGWTALPAVLASAFTTALLSPVLFALVERVDTIAAARREDAVAAP